MNLNEVEETIRRFAYDIGHLSKNLYYLMINAAPEVKTLDKLTFKIEPSLKQVAELLKVEQDTFKDFFTSQSDYDSFIEMLEETKILLNSFTGEARYITQEESESLWTKLRGMRGLLQHFKIMYKEDFTEAFRSQ
jgi:hypothetical protein